MKYYGAHTEKALRNFPFSCRRVPMPFIYAMVEIKKAAARAHQAVAELDADRASAIVAACDEVLAGKCDDQFVLPAIQGGAGTSMHMNVNEVIAGRATHILAQGGTGIKVHAIDHVNQSQSTNDVIPSALKMTMVRLSGKVCHSLDALATSLEHKARQFADVPKLGRTHLQDAVPTTFGAEFTAYAAYVRRGIVRLERLREDLQEINLGGTAIGNCINASPAYRARLYDELRDITGLAVRPAGTLMAHTSSASDFVALSQALTAVCVDLAKIGGDFRLLASGPRGGLGELKLAELQAGSSIMPGKVNPIMPETVCQLYYVVSGNNVTIEHAAEGAQLELGVMLPVVIDRLVESFTLADEIVLQFARACVDLVEVDAERAKEHLERSTAYATLLTPVIGYDATASCVKKALANGHTFRQVVLEQNLLPEAEFDRATTLS